MPTATEPQRRSDATPIEPAPGSGFAANPRKAFQAVREATVRRCDPLQTEDYGLQSMDSCSPAKWHLAHTTWFFETFVLRRSQRDYQAFHETFNYLFNSYYETVGRMHPRPQRGLITRPTVAEIYSYRDHVDERIETLLTAGALDDEAMHVLELGLHHEQQHQELILTDVKHGLSRNPLRPAYREGHERVRGAAPPPLQWVDHPGGVARIGASGHGFTFDNEGPSHRVFVEPFALASRPITCAEYLEFMDDGGYRRPELWLSAGWETLQRRAFGAPEYWEHRDGAWWQFSLDGMREVDPNEPVCHVSYFEADAYARWTGFRLPTEFDWEIFARDRTVAGNFAESGALHPRPAPPGPGADPLVQMFGDVWEWTMSGYSPYPGYRAPVGALGEYNGKFMCSQLVLRGGSCATPAAHVRPTYRNFFYPEDRWQFTGFRLARDR